jgi:hypothetical protein
LLIWVKLDQASGYENYYYVAMCKQNKASKVLAYLLLQEVEKGKGGIL